MHVPDGFIDAPVSAAAGVVAAAAVAVSLRGARRELGALGAATPADGFGGGRTAPLAGLVAAFIFAVQMLNFPVGAGTSGHLLGGALASILVGPCTAVLCLSVVLVLQAVLFADGGLTALGVNIVLMAVVTVLCAYPLFRALLLLLPRGRRSITAAGFTAALVSVPAAAAAFTGIYAVGGTADLPLGKVLTMMVGVHFLIGVGEAVITALTIGAVIAVRPDLVHGARGLTQRLTLRTTVPAVPRTPLAAGAGAGAPSALPGPPQGLGERAQCDSAAADPVPADPAPAGTTKPREGERRRSYRKAWLAGAAVALLCAGGISFYASPAPDGLERVAEDQGISERKREHRFADSPLADYGVRDVGNQRLSVGLAGAIGVGATLLVGSGGFILLAKRTSASRRATEAGPHSGSGSSPGTGGDPGTGTSADHKAAAGAPGHLTAAAPADRKPV